MNFFQNFFSYKNNVKNTKLYKPLLKQHQQQMKLEDVFDSIVFNEKENNVKEILENYSNDDWKDFILIKPVENYTRVKIYENRFFDAYIITWNKNKKAQIHDHANNGCFLKVLYGRIQEKIYNKITLECIEEKNYEKNMISFMNNNKGYHSIENINENDISVSLHIYSPPNHKTKYYS